MSNKQTSATVNLPMSEYEELIAFRKARVMKLGTEYRIDRVMRQQLDTANAQNLVLLKQINGDLTDEEQLEYNKLQSKMPRKMPRRPIRSEINQ